MTKRGLNVGAGRAQFPVTPENKKYSEHLAHALANVPEAYDKDVEWVNIDRVAQPGIAEVVNVFRYPWIKSSDGKPFEDNSFDVVIATHMIEHIPHQIKLHHFGFGTSDIKGMSHHGVTVDKYLLDLEDNDGDGWFAWFYQAWKVLKPGGLLHIVCPYAWAYSGMSDPTHTRYILPGSFSYFVPNPDAPFDYQIPYRFDAVQLPGKQGAVMFRFVQQSMAYLDRIKQTEDMLELDNLYKGLDAHVTQHINQIEDMYLVFRAVK